jgi:hypothetical protein
MADLRHHRAKRTVEILKAFPWLGLALLASCGGTTSAHDGVGGSNGGTTVEGSPEGGVAAGGTPSDGGASAGVGGKVPDFPGNSPLACNAPYAGPTGGPRGDGPPEQLGACASIPDAIVLARYKDYAARVPQGLYYEPIENIAFWNEPCSNSAEETVAKGPSEGMGTFVESFSSEWFYEAVYCYENSVRRIERNLRCDYFDGVTLANPTPARLVFLASLLWWGNYYDDLGAAAILGHTVTSDDASDIVDFCSVSVTTGDFGRCDDVRVVNTQHLLMFDGTVKLGTPEVVRILKGNCH